MAVADELSVSRCAIKAEISKDSLSLRNVISICRKAGFLPEIVHEIAPINSVIGLAAAGVGISVVPSFAKRVPASDTYPCARSLRSQNLR